MNVAPPAIPSAVSPPGLYKVACQTYLKVAETGKLVVLAFYLNIIISKGVKAAAIVKLEANDASKILTNWYLPFDSSWKEVGSLPWSK